MILVLWNLERGQICLCWIQSSWSFHDPANLIARMGLLGPVWLTMINGKVVYHDGVLHGIDEKKLAKEAESTCTRVIRNRSSKYNK